MQERDRGSSYHATSTTVDSAMYAAPGFVGIVAMADAMVTSKEGQWAQSLTDTFKVCCHGLGSGLCCVGFRSLAFGLASYGSEPLQISCHSLLPRPLGDVTQILFCYPMTLYLILGVVAHTISQ